MNDSIQIASSFVIEKCFEELADLVKTKFVNKWTKYRVNCFFDEFRIAIASDDNEAFLKLDKILKSEEKSEILFNSLRSVLFSRSKSLAPKIIAALTARILNDNRDVSTFERSFIEFLEISYDDEILELFDFLKKYIVEGNKTNINYSDEFIELSWHDEQIDTSINYSISSGFNLGACLGKWASKAEYFLLFKSDFTEKIIHCEEDSERNIDYDFTLKTLNYLIYIDKGFLGAYSILDKTIKASIIKNSYS